MSHCEYWRFIDTGSGCAGENMAIDEAILESCTRGGAPPCLRFYTWRAPAITIGYLQDLVKAVRVEECIASEIEVVRRITGGRAVVHHKDLSFSLVFPAKGKVVPRGIGPSYRKIAKGFINGLGFLGLDAHLANGRLYQDISSQERRDISACFLTRISSEVLVGGRKLVGAAQRHMDGWVLQQGSLMVDVDRRLWAELLNYPSGLDLTGVMDKLKSGMTSICEASGKDMAMAFIKKALLEGLSMALDIRFEHQGLFPEEREETIRLEGGKYRDLLGERCFSGIR